VRGDLADDLAVEVDAVGACMASAQVVKIASIEVQRQGDLGGGECPSGRLG
jgi:hypothetical protein